MINVSDIFAGLKEAFGDKILDGESKLDGHSPWIAVNSPFIAEVAAFLKEHKEFPFETVHLISGVDYPDNDKIAVVYHLQSFKLKGLLTIKCSVDRIWPILPSIVDVWRAADWLERETFDLLGVRFTGRTEIRRILLADDWDGHPLRKDYVNPETVQGLPNTPAALKGAGGDTES